MMFKKTLLLSLLAPFIAQAVEITNNSSKTIRLSCYNKNSVHIDDIKDITPYTNMIKSDITTIIASYNYLENQIWPYEFRLENLTDESKVSFTEENSKILATIEINGQKTAIEAIGLEIKYYQTKDCVDSFLENQ